MARILIVAYTTYAQDARVKRQAEALASRGDDVEVICLATGQVGATKHVTVLDLQLPRYRGNSPSAYVRSYLQFIIRAAAVAVKRSFHSRYDVVVVCSMPDALVISALPCRLFGSKILLDVKDTMPELYLDKFDDGKRGRLGARLLMIEERLSAALADRVLAVHDPHSERLQKARISPSKIAVVTNLPDPRIFKPASPEVITERFKRLRADSDFTIVCHGTVVRRLGLDTAIEALALLRTRLPDVRLRIIGSGDYLDDIKSMSRRLNVESAVSFEEPVPVEELPGKLADSSVGLVPNRATSATHLMLPVKLLEFATLGIPVIAARLHTIEHYFGEDAVRYFTPGDSGTLAEAIEELYFSPARRHALAQRALQMTRKLSWQLQSERYYQAVDTLVYAGNDRANRNMPEIAAEN